MKVDFNDKDQDGKTEFAKVHSFLKQCCARSSVYQNKVLVYYSWLIGFVKSTFFDNVNIVQTLF